MTISAQGIAIHNQFALTSYVNMSQGPVFSKT